VHQRPLRISRIISDAYLNSRAHLLRMDDINTLYRNDYTNHEIVKNAA
jgi:hypothetical protein